MLICYNLIKAGGIINKSIKKNYIYNLFFQIFNLLLPLITIAYLSRVLGSSGIGTFSYTQSIITYFIIFGSVGISLYGQREIAYNQNNIDKRSKTFWELFFLKCITMSISLILFFITLTFFKKYTLFFKILSLELIANIFDISWFYQGIEEFKKNITRNCLVKILNVLLIFIFIKDSSDIIKYFIIYVITLLTSNLSLWINIKNYIKKIKLKDLNIFYHFKFTLLLFIPQIAIQIYTVLDKSMIGFIVKDMSIVGYYEQAEKIIKVILTIITSISTIMLPRIANCYSLKNQDKIKEYMYKTFNFILFLSFPMIFGLLALASTFIPIFLGPGYESVIPIIQLMSLIILFIGFSNIIGYQYLLPTKKQKEYTISVIIGSIINFILNIILIKNFKAIGATIATLIAEFFVMGIQFYFIRHEFSLKKIFNLGKNYIFASIIMFIYCFILKDFINNTKILLFAQLFIGIFIYMVLLILLKDKAIIYLVNIINKKVKFFDKFKVKYLKVFNELIRKILIIIISLGSLLLIIYHIFILPIINEYYFKKSSNLGWEKYSSSQILGNNETGTLFDPNVIKINNTYMMYVSSRKEKSIMLSTSLDGINWTKLKVVLKPNKINKWEENINRASILYYNNKYYMYYTGQTSKESKIGLAISDDGINFTKYNENPILIPDKDYEKSSIMNPYVIYDYEEDIFKMWYSAGDIYEPDVICFATSYDGINFTKQGIVMKPSNKKNTLDSYKVSVGDVKKIGNNKYIMFYIGYTKIDKANILFATSNDGINWKKSNKIAIISNSKSGFDKDSVYKPTCVFDELNNTWLMWYNGRNSYNEYIGLATCKNCKF